MSVIVKGGGGKSSGLYVWGKYDKRGFTGAVTTDDTGFTITLKSLDGDSEFRNLFTTDYLIGAVINLTVDATNDVTFTLKADGLVDSDVAIESWSLDETTKIMTVISSSIYGVELAPTISSAYFNHFVDYVVSDNETAYPDGATHTDGFYYEIFDKTGLYVWKKCERQYNLIEIATGQSVYVITDDITTVYYSDNYSISDNGNVVLENPQSVSWEATAYPSSSLEEKIANALKGHYVIVGEYKSGYSRYEVLTAISGKNVCLVPSTATVGGTSGCVPFDDIATIYNGEITDNFVCYIVSNDPTAYPDGGEQGGYWYELFDLKSFGIDFGEVTLASNSQTIKVSHNLDVAPSFVAIFLKIPHSGTSAGLTQMNINGVVLYGTDLAVASKANVITSTQITFNAYSSTKKFEAGDYYWIAVV